jgi:glycosyltransferase involved in cell wall biosynthesis
MAPDRNSLRVDVVIPIYNEEKILRRSIDTLREFLRNSADYEYRIVIADNASVDRSEEIGRAIAHEYADVQYRRLDRKGRGLALKETWSESRADIVTYMDVDLSTNLESFPEMIHLLRTGTGVVIGTRLSPYSRTTRSLKREILSRGYNLLVKLLFRTRFSDAQCGFKGARREIVQEIVPRVTDVKWFFDTEFLVLAEKSGQRVREIPVHWIEDLDTRVELIRTIADDLVALVRLRRDLRKVLPSIRKVPNAVPSFEANPRA